MSFLFRKMLRSIRQYKLQFLSVLLLATLSVTVYSGLEGIWSGIEYEYGRFSEETNLADEWVYATYFTDEDIAAVRGTAGVSDVSARLRITVEVSAAESAQNPSAAAEPSSRLSLDTVGNESISSMRLIEGVPYDRTHTDSVWINSDYSEANDIAVGDTLALTLNNTTVEVSVAGIVMSAERAHFVGSSDYYVPDHHRFGYGYMSDDLASAFGIPYRCNLLAVTSEDSALKERVNDILGSRFLAYYDRDTMFEVSFVNNQAGNLKRISLLFSGLFLLLAVMSMRTTIKRLIDAQRSDITTLKSLGFSNHALILHYASYGLLVSIPGTILGFLCSFPFTKALQPNQQRIISIPEWPIRHTVGSLLVILLLVFLSFLTAVLAAVGAIRGLPAESADRRGKTARNTLLERLPGFWRKISFGLRWTLRDAAAHKARISLGVISVCGSFMLLMIGFGTPDSIKAFTDKTYGSEFTYTNKLTLTAGTDPSYVDSLAEKLNGQMTEVLQSRMRVVKGGEAGGSVAAMEDTYFKTVTVFSDGTFINLETTDGRTPGDDGAYITEGMAEALGIKRGDTVELFPSGSERSFSFVIAGIIPSSMPQTLYITERCWTSAGAAFRPTHMLTSDIADPTAVKADPAVSQLLGVARQANNLDEFRTAFSGIFNLMKTVAFALVVIVLYNLSVLSFIERAREYNTFRVLGFHYGEIRLLASFENILILGLGALAGLPLGFRFLKLYCSNFSNDTLKIYASITGADLARVCSIVFLCTLATTLLLSLRIRRIDMVEALK
ncbi:MAG: ABC transporter permease [Lachnospiraceae bacterium]|nr:ABC transporter permease [Lachnospiraceae bacterium]